MEPSKGFKEIHHRIEPLFLEEGSLRFLRLTCFFRREAGGQICLTKKSGIHFWGGSTCPVHFVRFLVRTAFLLTFAFRLHQPLKPVTNPVPGLTGQRGRHGDTHLWGFFFRQLRWDTPMSSTPGPIKIFAKPTSIWQNQLTIGWKYLLT